MIKKLFTILALCCFTATHAQENNETEHQSNGNELIDFENRIEVINYCEFLKDVYKTKDIESLKNIFSGDTYIYTNNKILCINTGDKSYRGHIEAEKYLQLITHFFKQLGDINITFSNYNITKAKSDIYIVKMTHELEFKDYNCSGIMILMCDISDATNPKFKTLAWENLNE